MRRPSLRRSVVILCQALTCSPYSQSRPLEAHLLQGGGLLLMQWPNAATGWHAGCKWWRARL